MSDGEEGFQGDSTKLPRLSRETPLADEAGLTMQKATAGLPIRDGVWENMHLAWQRQNRKMDLQQVLRGCHAVEPPNPRR